MSATDAAALAHPAVAVDSATAHSAALGLPRTNDIDHAGHDISSNLPSTTSTQSDQAISAAPAEAMTKSNVSPSASQPMTRATSTSSTSSAKDDSAPAPTYGTRSKHRNGPRPNYNDDIPADFELPLNVASKNSKKKAVSTNDVNDASKTTSDANITKPAGPTLRLTYGNSASKAHPVAESEKMDIDSVAQSIESNPRQERKKRKYERHSADSSATALTPQQSIPGTSQFTVSGANGAGGAQSSKRRRVDPDDENDWYYKICGQQEIKPAGSNVVTFEKSGAIPVNGKLTADDGTAYSPEDHVYLVCEPPGDPYYLCRIMEFRRANPDDPKTPVTSLLVNWFYRPKDIGRYSPDSRLLYASMQSDESPITSLRGKCEIRHKSEIDNLDLYRKQRNTFHFNQLYDRYSHRPYDMLASRDVINVPERVKKALNDRWRFIVVEPPRQKELTSDVKLCKRCNLYCAPDNSVDCGVCRETWHMTCVKPPLTKKPSRGFAWSCGPCSRAQERKLEQRHSAIIAPSSQHSHEEEAVEEEEEEAAAAAGTVVSAPENEELEPSQESPATRADMSQIRMWPWRYLGIHCKVEDVLQFDDRSIYPRASSRLGPKHQATVVSWFGHPVEYIQPVDAKRKNAKAAASKAQTKLSKEAVAALEQEKSERAKRPQWIQDAPPGYIARGDDLDEDDPNCTATPLFIPPSLRTGDARHSENQQDSHGASGTIEETMLDPFFDKVRNKTAEKWGLVTQSKKGVPQVSTNFLDRALKVFSDTNFDESATMAILEKQHSAKFLKDPDFTKEEIKKFETGVAKHGSELRNVRKYHLKSRSHGEVVRFYYTWKFSQRGDQVWGTQKGRKGAKRRAEASWTDADNEDDSAFDTRKAIESKKPFVCKFCSTHHSRQWRRAPNTAAGEHVLDDLAVSANAKSNQRRIALCDRCAVLWRRYGLQWEDPDEIAKSISQSGGRAWRKKNEEDLLRELVLANEEAGISTNQAAASAAAAIGIVVTVLAEPPKKRTKVSLDGDAVASTESSKKKVAPAAPVPAPPPKEPTPPIVPDEPKFRSLPCAVCLDGDPRPDPPLMCKECRLTVHRQCYGASDNANVAKWVCETCLNDREQKASLSYECTLCPVAHRQVDLLEPPKATHKKKSEREKEKERLERELGQKFIDEHIKKQKAKGSPVYPREALKQTESNNWIHITCAIWTPEMRFTNSDKMEGAEGMGAIITNPSRISSKCVICKVERGSVVGCHQCHENVHVECAHQAGSTFGFDVVPVKGSRKDTVPSATVGNETGAMSAVFWCKSCTPKTIVHQMTEQVEDSGFNAIRHYAMAYKQSELTLTGTARKANQLSQLVKTVVTPVIGNAQSRRTSLISAKTNTNSKGQNAVPADDNEHITNGDALMEELHTCRTCGTDASLKWHCSQKDSSFADSDNDSVIDNHGANGVSADHEEEEKWQCHQCHTRQKQGLPPAVKPNHDSSVHVYATKEPDLFEMTETSPNQFPTQYHHPSVTAIPQLPSYGPAIDKFAKDLWDMTIEIKNTETGGSHVFRGRYFGLELDADPHLVWTYVQFFATTDCQYNREDKVITTEDGSWITFAKHFMQALIKMSALGQKEGKWKVQPTLDLKPISMDDTHRSVMQQLNLQWPPVYCPAPMREPSRKSKYPPVAPPRKQPYLPPPRPPPTGLPPSVMRATPFGPNSRLGQPAPYAINGRPYQGAPAPQAPGPVLSPGAPPVPNGYINGNHPPQSFYRAPSGVGSPFYSPPAPPNHLPPGQHQPSPGHLQQQHLPHANPSGPHQSSLSHQPASRPGSAQQPPTHPPSATRPETPQGPQSVSILNGASSSPNLKNLVNPGQ